MDPDPEPDVDVVDPDDPPSSPGPATEPSEPSVTFGATVTFAGGTVTVVVLCWTVVVGPCTVRVTGSAVARGELSWPLATIAAARPPSASARTTPNAITQPLLPSDSAWRAGSYGYWPGGYWPWGYWPGGYCPAGTAPAGTAPAEADPAAPAAAPPRSGRRPRAAGSGHRSRRTSRVVVGLVATMLPPPDRARITRSGRRRARAAAIRDHPGRMPDAIDEWDIGLLDLRAYLRRIGHDGAGAPGAATLAALHRAHLAAIPFENLDIPLGRGIAVDLESVQAKLVARRRGGYCYEHGLLFAAALERLGYPVDRFLARVGGDVVRPRGADAHDAARADAATRRGSPTSASGRGCSSRCRSAPAGPTPRAAGPSRSPPPARTPGSCASAAPASGRRPTGSTTSASTPPTSSSPTTSPRRSRARRSSGGRSPCAATRTRCASSSTAR